ncbi:MAG TPA: hypothetical protein VJQ51_00350 [Burkholderiales bacterium]|nr:hypothetical protein [Burkholderiales bacterium]
MKLEFSSSDLVLALAIVNGTVATGARPLAEHGDARAAKTQGEPPSCTGACGSATGHVR